MEEHLVELKETARQLRIDLLTAIYRAGDGHPGPALGIVEILTALYFDKMNIDPAHPDAPDRDRFILSKGHACPALYAALARVGYFPMDTLPTLRSCGSILQGHPCIETPGVDMTSGSLGNGIAIGLGMALGAQRSGRDFYTYVITGDGELNEGVCWEGIMAAHRNHADHLIVFIDRNGFQSGGSVEEISMLDHVGAKFRSFGWNVLSIDGNDLSQVLTSINQAKQNIGTPTAIVAHTIKGKGISYMENNNLWHKYKLSEQLWQQAIRELGE